MAHSPCGNIIIAKKNEYSLHGSNPVRAFLMDDVQAPPIGTKGTVEGVDDTASLHVAWDNGSHLNVIYGEDEAHMI